MDRSSKEKRAPAALKVKYKSGSVNSFIEQAGLNISRGGIFIRTKKPMSAGTPLKFEFQLSDATPVIRGVGQVVWCREKDIDKNHPAGMGVRFLKLDASGRALVERIVQERGEVRSRFDTKGGPDPLASRKPSPPTPSPTSQGDASRSIPTIVRSSPQQDSSNRKEQIGHVGEFLASALGQSVVSQKGAPHQKGELSVEPIESAKQVIPPIEDLLPREESVEKAKADIDPAGDLGHRFQAQVGSQTLPKDHEGSAQSLEDELFGDLETQIVSPPSILNPEMLSKPPVVAEREEHRPGPINLENIHVVDSVIPKEDKRKEESDQDYPPLFSDRAPPLSGRASDPSQPMEGFSSFSSTPPAKTAGQSEGTGESLSSPQGTSPATQPSTESTGYDPSLSAGELSSTSGYSPLPSELTAAPPLDAAPPLSIAPPSQRAESLKSNRILFVGLGICLIIGMIAGGAAYFHLREEIPRTSITDPTRPVEALATQHQPAVVAKVVEAAPKGPSSSTIPKEPLDTESKEGETQTDELVEMTKVLVTSQPKDAQIQIDGEPRGSTPTRLELPIGKLVKVTATVSGYKAVTQQVEATKNHPPIRFNLPRLDYVLVVRTIPPGASVSALGKTVKSPQPLMLGKLSRRISVSLSKTGYRKLALPLALDQFEEIEGVMRKQLAVKLIPLPSTTKRTKPVPPPPPATSSQLEQPKEALKIEEPAQPAKPKRSVVLLKEDSPPDDSDKATEGKQEQNPYGDTEKAVESEKKKGGLPENPF